jgi:PII-like signaling protein
MKMDLSEKAKLLRIFIGVNDMAQGMPLSEAIVREARNSGLAGATAWQGIMSFGPTSRVRCDKGIDLSVDKPVIVEIVDEEERIDAFLPKLSVLFDESRCGGLVTMEKVEVLRYDHGSETGKCSG